MGNYFSKSKIRKSGVGVYQLNERLWEGSFLSQATGRRAKKCDIYARTRNECEKMLKEMRIEKKRKQKS